MPIAYQLFNLNDKTVIRIMNVCKPNLFFGIIYFLISTSVNLSRDVVTVAKESSLNKLSLYFELFLASKEHCFFISIK